MFGELTGRARAAAAAADAAADAAAACGLYAQALEMWRGEPAADAAVLRDHPAVAGLARRRVDAVLQYADAASGLGWHGQVIPLLEALAWEQPLDERVHAGLMVALAGTGQQAAAIKVHENLRLRLDEELGVRPGPGLAAAYQRVLRQDIPPASAASTAPNRPGRRATPPSASGIRYSLPPDTAAFTGRQAELDRITAAATNAAGPGGVAAVHTISGMPGSGKTALAVHTAHVLTSQFPDRQLFLDLQAHTPGQRPVSPEAALAGLLAAVGVNAQYLPGDLDGLAALWRDRMAGQQALLVLDNAASSAQVTPLLPGSEGCLVLVTSRRHLGDLPSAAAAVSLEAFPAQEAREMFTRLAPRTADGPEETVAELVELAGRLPLAISLLARVCARHPSWALADLAAETRNHMLTLAAESDSVAAAFEVSYQNLDPGLQEFFRRLGLHPGTAIDCYSAAALADCALDTAAQQLDALHGEGLLTEAGHRRYSMHDLIRSYAWDLAAADPAGVRERALEQLLDYYQHTAARAETILARQARAVSPASSPRTPPAAIPGMTDAAQALAWVRAERASLLACLDHATAAGQHSRVVALTGATASLLRLDGPWTSAVTRHTTAVSAARHVGDRLGQANTLTYLGDARRLTGNHHGADKALREALSIYHDIGHQQGQATVLTYLGAVRLATGDHHGADGKLREALGMFHDIGDRGGEAMALNETGTLHRVCGDPGQAAECHRQALNLAREITSPWDEAHALAGLARCALADGRTTDTAAMLRQARDIFQRISASEAADITAELGSPP